MRHLITLLALASLPGLAVEVTRVDTAIADAVLSSLESGGLTPGAIYALNESDDVEALVAAAVAVGLPAHVNGYLDALDLVAAGEPPSVDLYAFATLPAMLPRLRALEAEIVADPSALDAAIGAALAPYSNHPNRMAVKLVLVAGAGTCASASEDLSTVYLDLRCVAVAPDGISAMLAHSMLHGGSSDEMPVQALMDPTMARLDHLLRSAVVEAGATYRSGSGAVPLPVHQGALDAVAYQENSRRAPEVMTVTQALLHAAGADPEADPDTLERLLLGGPWGAPLEWLSYTVVAAIGGAEGEARLGALLDGPPEELFLAYAALPATSQPVSLSHPSLEVLQMLRRSRTAASAADSGMEMPLPADG